MKKAVIRNLDEMKDFNIPAMMQEKGRNYLLIGSDPRSDIVFRGGNVSDCHGILLYHKSEEYSLKDISSGGIWLNRVPMRRFSEMVLRHGDRIRLGNLDSDMALYEECTI